MFTNHGNGLKPTVQYSRVYPYMVKCIDYLDSYKCKKTSVLTLSSVACSLIISLNVELLSKFEFGDFNCLRAIGLQYMFKQAKFSCKKLTLFDFSHSVPTV